MDRMDSLESQARRIRGDLWACEGDQKPLVERLRKCVSSILELRTAMANRHGALR